jgi:hypothetical protein
MEPLELWVTIFSKKRNKIKLKLLLYLIFIFSFSHLCSLKKTFLKNGKNPQKELANDKAPKKTKIWKKNPEKLWNGGRILTIDI